MTDNEIIKALECCSKPVGEACKECPLNSQGVDCLDFDIDKLIIDLINRQKSEIERLKTNLNVELENFATEYDNKIKAEAYKEFAEELIKRLYLKGDMVEEINNLVKEMVGEG